MKFIFRLCVAYIDESTNRDQYSLSCIVITFSLTTTPHKPLGRKQPNSTKSFTSNEVVHIIMTFFFIVLNSCVSPCENGKCKW